MPLESEGYYANRAERSAETAAKSGAITHVELSRWLEALREEIAAKRFLGGQVHLFKSGERARYLTERAFVAAACSKKPLKGETMARKKIEVDFEYEEVLDAKTRRLVHIGAAVAAGCPT